MRSSEEQVSQLTEIILCLSDYINREVRRLGNASKRTETVHVPQTFLDRIQKIC